MRLLRVGEVELCVDEHGDPGDPLVVLVHGAAAPMDWWEPEWCRALAGAGRRVVRYDHRDTGQSTTGPVGAPAYDGGVLEADLVGLVEALDAGAAHLVGVSMGAGIAQSLALRRPDLVSGLTLVATTAVGGVDADLPGMSPALQRLFAEPPAQPDWRDREQAVAFLVEAQRAFAGSVFDEERVREAAGQVVDRSIDPAAADNHRLVVGSGEEGLDVRDIDVPTLVVHGTDDPMFPLPHGEALAAAIPGARLIVVEGMGHEPPPPAAWPEVVAAIAAI